MFGNQSPLELAQYLVEEKQFKSEVKTYFTEEKTFKTDMKSSLVTVSTKLEEVNTKFDLLRGMFLVHLLFINACVLIYCKAPIIKGDLNISGVQILQTIHQLVEDNTKMQDELKEKNERVETLREKINEIHKKNEK